MSITTERGTIPIHEDMITVPAAGKIARIGQRIGEYQTIGQAAGFCFGFGGVKEIEIRKVDRWYKRVFGGDADGKVQP